MGAYCGTVSGCQPPEPGRRGSDGLLANLAICPHPVRAALRPLPHCPEPRVSPRLLLAVLPADMIYVVFLCVSLSGCKCAARCPARLLAVRVSVGENGSPTPT